MFFQFLKSASEPKPTKVSSLADFVKKLFPKSSFWTIFGRFLGSVLGAVRVGKKFSKKRAYYHGKYANFMSCASKVDPKSGSEI